MSSHGWKAGAEGRFATGFLVLAGAMPAMAGGGHDPVWTHESGDENWIGEVVSVGNDGTQVFAAVGTLNSHARLFSAHDTNPPTPLWSDLQPAFAYDHAVDSAAHADVHAHLNYEAPDIYASNTPVVSVYDSAQPEPHWSWAFPFTVTHPNGGVLVSDDGEVVVGWVFDSAAGKTAIASFVGGSGQPAHYATLSTFGEPKAVRMASDGSVVYIASMIKTILVDPSDGQVFYEQINWEGVGNGHALAGDGSRFAQVIPDNRVRVFDRQGDTYVENFTYQGPGPTICGRLDLSADGSLLACTFDFYNTWLKVRIVAMDLTAPGTPIVVDDTTVGEGTYSNVASDVSVAADGSAFAVGLWGDEAGLSPEVRVYRQSHGNWNLVGLHDLPGSVNDVDMSADGRTLAVASKGIHANQLGGDGRIDLYEVDAPQLTLAGVPTAGSTVHFRHQATPNSFGRLLFSPALAEEPHLFPNAGMLYLDRDLMEMMPIRHADDDGVIETAFDVPGGAPLIGTSIYFQGMTLNPRRFTDNWVKLTILP